MPAIQGSGAELMRVISAVSPQYFRALGTRIIAGRPFTDADGPGAPLVVIVDASLAEVMWPGQTVAGQCRPLAPGQPCVEIVGVSESRRLHSLTNGTGEIFYPLAQRAEHAPQALVVRARDNAHDAVPMLTALLRALPQVGPFVSVRALEELADSEARSWRLGRLLFGLFGGVAMALAAVGIYATLSFSVRQQTPEIGLRMALGATRGRIALATVGRGAKAVGLGCALGVGGAVGFAYSATSLFFGVEPTTPQPFVIGTMIVCLAGAAGCLVPVLRASRVNLSKALRDQ
jgi:hypothetical protein